MSILIKCIEIEEFAKSNNSNLTPHFVGNEIFEVAGWTVPPLRKFKKGKTMVKKEIINKLKDLELAIEALQVEREDEESQGKWEYCEHEIADHVDGYKCSHCGFFIPWDYMHKSIYFIEDYNFCPSCGARMLREDDKGYELATEQMEHDAIYEPTYNPEDGSM